MKHRKSAERNEEETEEAVETEEDDASGSKKRRPHGEPFFYLGTLLLHLRQKNGLTRMALQELSGVHAFTIKRTEEMQSADPDTVRKLAEVFGVDPVVWMIATSTSNDPLVRKWRNEAMEAVNALPRTFSV